MNLKEQRVKKNLTQQELANLVEMDRSTIAKIENGGSLSVSAAKKIARALDFNWVLFYESTSKKSRDTNSA